MSYMTPREIVHELDKHIIGQDAAKRAVAIALRDRWRRSRVEAAVRQEITPKNILMIGPTGVGKTEIARRLARLLGHAGTTGAAVSHLLGLPQVPWAWERLSVGHATATRLRTVPIADGAIFSLRSLGDGAHLDGLGPRTGQIIP